MSDGVKWIKLSVNILSDEKITVIENLPDGDALAWIWIKLLALAGKVNDSGKVYLSKEIPYTDQSLAAVFRKPITTINLALKTFSELGMIEITDDIIRVSNWEKYQNIKGLDDIKEYERIKKRKQRERKRIEQTSDNENSSSETDAVSEANGVSRDSPGTSPQFPSYSISNSIDSLSSKELNELKDIDNITRTDSKRFIPPTVEEVRIYCSEKNYTGVDPEYFVDYYQMRGWVLTNGKKMVDWKAAVRNWVRMDRDRKRKNAPAEKDDFGDFLHGGN